MKSSRSFEIFLIAFFVTVSIVVVLFATGVIRFNTSAGPPVKYGFLGTDGELVVPIEYDSVSDFHQGLATVYKNGKPFVIDRSGHKVDTPPFHYRIDTLNTAHIRISSDGKEKSELNHLFTPMGGTSDGTTLFRILRKHGSGKGNELVYDFAYFFVTPSAPVAKAKLYEEALPYHDNLAAVKNEIGKIWKSRWSEKSWGFIDRDGNYKAGPYYCDVHSFSEGLAAVAIKMVPHAL
jgi:hypothetical protein